jgi:hypothetical protein
LKEFSIMAKYDDMSFGKAFAAARKEKGAGNTFTWKGKSYSTNRADDKPSKNKSGSTDIAAMAKEAIDRSGPTRPRARPGSDEKPTRPRARPVDKAPTATSVSTPEVSTEKLPNRSERTERPSGPKGPSPLAASETAGPRGNKPFAGTKPTLEEWEAMSPMQRVRWGVVTKPRMAQGGMVKKSGYAKGGMVKANCGASMKPTQKGTSKK